MKAGTRDKRGIFFFLFFYELEIGNWKLTGNKTGHISVSKFYLSEREEKLTKKQAKKPKKMAQLKCELALLAFRTSFRDVHLKNQLHRHIHRLGGSFIKSGNCRNRKFSKASHRSLSTSSIQQLYKTGTTQERDRQAQIEAYQKIEDSLFYNHYNGDDGSMLARRATVVMPGGSGKTRVGLRAVERAFLDPAVHGNNVVLVLLPRLSLLEQTVREYMSESHGMLNDWSSQALALCSSFSQKHMFPNTTDTKKLESFLFGEGSRDSQSQHTNKKIVFSTYKSLKVLQEVLRDHKNQSETAFALSLIVMDEAHFTAGRGYDR